MPIKHIKSVIESKGVREHIYRIALSAVLLLFAILIFSIIRRSVWSDVDPKMHIYFEIVLLLLLAVLAEVAVFYFKTQSVIILMVLGMMISPGFMRLAWNSLVSLGLVLPSNPPVLFLHSEIINIFAQLGAIILLFKVGLHSKIARIFSWENMIVASAGILLPLDAGYFYASFTGGNFAYSLFMGTALAATSVGVTVAILKEMKVLNEKFSEVIIGAAVIDDILGLLLLSAAVNITQAGGYAVSSLVSTLLTALVFIFGAILSGNYFIRYFDREEMDHKRFMLALAFMLFLSYVAEAISLSAIIGAFIAGIILNTSRHYSLIEEKTYALEYLFMPIFFISLGILIDVKAIAAFFAPIIIITLIAVSTKTIGCGAAALLAKLNLKESLIVGVGMVPRGEVALIIASIGLTQGVLSQNEYSVLSAMALLTSIMVPSVLSYMLRKAGS